MMLFIEPFVALGRISTSFRLILSESAIEATRASSSSRSPAARPPPPPVGHRLRGRRPDRSRPRPATARAPALARRPVAPPTLSARATPGAADHRRVLRRLSQLDLLLVGALLGTTAAGIYGAPIELTTLLHYPGLAAAQRDRAADGAAADRPPDPSRELRWLRIPFSSRPPLVAPDRGLGRPDRRAPARLPSSRVRGRAQGAGAVRVLEGLGGCSRSGSTTSARSPPQVPIAAAAAVVDLGLASS